MPRPDPSPFDVLEAAFRLLTTVPEPLSLDGSVVGHGLPARPINLGELRGMLLDGAVALAVRWSGRRDSNHDNCLPAPPVDAAAFHLRRLFASHLT